MKFDLAKAWPHPVLRPSPYGDDYPQSEFEVDIHVRVSRQLGDRVEVDAQFELSDPTLLRLVDDGAAEYIMVIKAPRTHFRQSVRSATGKMSNVFENGALAGRAEFAPFLVCTKAVSAFTSSTWHSDFDGMAFDLVPGTVLAEDIPKEYWIDTADEAPIGSIFSHRPDRKLADGRWRCDLGEDHVDIAMSPADSKVFARARELADDTPDAQYLMNGLYLPALLAVLARVDQDPEEYREFRWFASLDQRLEEIGARPLGEPSADGRLLDAQKILDLPFAKMPLIHNAREDSS